MTEEAPEQPFLVVIGSSAGGIEALTTALAALPKDFAAPIVIAQHLDPSRPSSLSTVLERRSALPVELVGAPVRMKNGHVYVVGSNCHITIHDGHVTSEGDHANRPRPSVDLLLSTAAQQYGEKLIAVVLTGAGSDGASGALEVKRLGGTVVIQNPATARFASMPLALPPTAVDHIVDIENLAALLTALVLGFEIRQEDGTTPDSLRDILGLVSSVARVDFTAYKQSTILRRITRRMVFTQQTTLDDYRGFLLEHPDEVHKLAMAFLIKVTEFFRDEDAFELLRERVLPVLIDRARARGRSLRLWSAGCATGEEPYSLAMLIADMLGAELADWSVKIFATDLDESSINFARRGLYPEKSLGKLPENFRQRFFEESDTGHQINKALRQMVIYGQQDISKGVPFPRIDLVVCRNLLIYFKSELQQHVLDLFAYSLSHTGGYLFLGKAETARPSGSSFDTIDKRWKVYRCTKPAMTISSRRTLATHSSVAFVADGRLRRTADRLVTPEVLPIIDPELAHLRRAYDLLLRVLPIGVVVIDRSYRVVTINQTARRLLAIRDLGHEHDFLHSARGLPYAKVRDAIDAVFRERGTATLAEIEIERIGTTPGRFLTLTVAYSQQDSDAFDVAIVSVIDATETVEARTGLESVQAEQTRLVAELTSANKRFADINKDLQDANEELQATNEEMTLAQEELQASNEELEATNEELQATNEELETNNEEQQATNEELEATNDELTARTQELQDVAQTLNNERSRLAEIMDAAPNHLLVLRGPTLVVDVANAAVAKVFGDRPWSGRPVEEVLLGEEFAPVVGLLREAYWKNASSSGQVVRFGNQTLELTVVPLHDGERVDGIVMFGSHPNDRASEQE